LRKKLIITVFSFYFLILIASLSLSDDNLSFRKQIVLDNSLCRVSVDIAGGSIICFSLKNKDTNPFTWNYPEKGNTAPRSMGHFVCFDRWGEPSQQEIKNGVPIHGEASGVIWDVFSQPSLSGEDYQVGNGMHPPYSRNEALPYN
jgi:hypothetical protein